MFRPTRQHALSLAAPRSRGVRSLARTQLWSELPTLVGVVAAVLGAIFL